MSRRFHSAYLADGMRGGAILPVGWGSPGDRRSQAQAAAARPLAPELLAELREQNRAWMPSARRDEHLALLGRGAAVVITGQQVGLFLGPLYALFKAASAIVMARALTAETGVPCVPLFWLQTEDQDFAEVASCQVPRPRAAPLRLSLVEEKDRERCSLAERTLGPDVTALVDRLEEALGSLPRAGEVIALLRTHYRPGATPGRAFASVLTSLFAKEGLLTYDPRQAVGAALARPVIRTALLEGPRLEEALLTRARGLERAGFDVQIPVREGASLAFFHVGSSRGPRYRLQRGAEGWTLPSGETLSVPELVSLLQLEPLRFSTSALLRPIVQDALFPTAAYVGGPAEVDYFAQLPPLYAAFGMAPPLVAIRARFRLVPARVRALLGHLGLTGADLDRPLAELSGGGSATASDAPSSRWLDELEARLDGYTKTVPTADRAWRRSVERTRQATQRAVQRLAHRHQAQVLARADVRVARLEEVARWLRPDGVPQERVYSFPAFAARVGMDELCRAVMDSVAPFESGVREIDL